MMKPLFATLSSAALIAALVPAARAGVGDTVSYKFSKPPVNSMGITSFEELRGKPVIIDFWGTH
jgi:hypothetical protein